MALLELSPAGQGRLLHSGLTVDAAWELLVDEALLPMEPHDDRRKALRQTLHDCGQTGPLYSAWLCGADPEQLRRLIRAAARQHQ